MKYTAFNESFFREKVEKAQETVQRILDVNRQPKLAEDQDHSYDDKYALAEFLTNTSIAAVMNIIERCGLTEEKLLRLHEMVHASKRSVTICFEAEESCSFLKEAQVDVVKYDVEHVVETNKASTGLFGTNSQKKESVKHQVIRKVNEYHWKVGVQYRIHCYEGNDPTKNSVELLSRSSSTTIVTTGPKTAPFPERTVHDLIICSLTWILQNIKLTDKQRVCGFKIDRTKETCRTPRRNEDIEDAVGFFSGLRDWFDQIRSHFLQKVETRILGLHSPANPIPPSQNTPKLYSISASQLFCPVVPLMDTHEASRPGTAERLETPKSLLVLTASDGSESSPLLSLGDIDKLLNEQCRALDEKMADLTAIFPSYQLMKLATVAEASLVLFALAAHQLFTHYQQSIEYIESMLLDQLITAIGKEIQPKDFHQFWQFHCQKIFTPRFAPKTFSYAIRRPDHYPDGIISIEGGSDSEKVEPISTHVRFIKGEDAPPISFPINAATNVEMSGDRFLHAWVNQRFESAAPGSFHLSARARQFSSFLLVIGVMAGPDKFVPKDSIILQNKDEVLIPLLLNELPTAKEFKDAILSLSPEQKRFATAFRGMQLESSVFGICVVQLKPQLEKLLGLPPDSLTKEIRLTQDLMSLFIDFQIPSDLLSFDGASDASVAEKVDRVRSHTKAVMDVITEAKKADMEEMEMKAKHNVHKMVAESDGVVWNEMPPPMMATAFGSPPLLQSARKAKVAKMPPGSRVSDGMVAMAMAAPAPTRPLIAGSAYYAGIATRGPQAVAPVQVSDNVPVTESVFIEQSGNTELALHSTGDSAHGMVDFTLIPRQLDSIFEKHDTDSAIRATILETSMPWRRMRQENLLAKMSESSLGKNECKSEMDKAFDLLDALSRSGSLPIEFAELHVVVAVSHCFENDLIGTVIQDNINPIEKVEKSVLMVASTIQNVPPQDLITTGPSFNRLTSAFPEFLIEASSETSEG